MKGLSFQRPIEYHLETLENEWKQGDLVRGTLRVKNSGTASVELQGIQVILAYADFKKLKAKDPETWEVAQTLVLAESLVLAPQAEERYSWSLTLDSACAITDKNGSLFLLYGDANLLVQGGQIDMPVRLHPILQSFLQTFETQFRFRRSYEKTRQEAVEIKLVPPDSKDYPSLDHLLCRARIANEVLELEYLFKMKALGKVETHVKVVSKSREVTQQWPKESYLSPGGYPNRETFRQAIQQALEEAKPKAIF